jgi:UDP-N-acetylmuramoyl-L-alanyl-D-glutamate--2,6-diaminopimelate ligase
MSQKFNEFIGHYKVTDNTENIGPGSVFFAIEGKVANGIDFVQLAIKNGAKEIVVSYDNFEKNKDKFIKFDKNVLLNVLTQKHSINIEYAKRCSAEYGDIHKKFNIIGITGTKGKSSNALITNELIKNFYEKNVALISGIHVSICNKIFFPKLTTPKPDYLNAFLDYCYKAHNTKDLVVEVSAQSLTLHRVFGLEFSTVLFTNFAHEHGEFYKNDEDYFNSKMSILKQLKINGNVICKYEEKKIINFIKNFNIENQKNFNLIKFSKENINADIYSKKIKSKFEGIKFEIKHKNKKQNSFFLNSKLHGEGNVLNLISSYAILYSINKTTFFNKKSIQKIKKIENFFIIPGRADRYKSENNIYFFIDIAHTPESFEIVLKELRKQTKNLITVFGCGGEKDKIKRPIMASIAEKYSDLIFLTEDNPRKEKVEQIINDVYRGFSNLNKVYLEIDRDTAIEKAIGFASKNSIIAILGKGREEGQIRESSVYAYKDIDSVQKKLKVYNI